MNPKLEGGGCCRSGSEVESACAADMPTMNAPLKYDDRSVRCRIRCSEKTLTAKRFALGEGMDKMLEGFDVLPNRGFKIHRLGEPLVAAWPLAARFFMRLALVIALGGRCGRRSRRASGFLTSGFWVTRFVLGPAICLAFFALAAISGGLFSAFLFAVFRGPVVQVGLGDAPPPSRLLTFAIAVAIQGMIGKKVAIAPLE